MTALPVTTPPEATVPTVRMTDGVLDAIHERLATIEPEHGGALLETDGLVHLFVDDTSGRYSRASWDISKDLSAVVGLLERRGHGVLAGTVHSHPAGIADPSGTDVRTTALALRMNPHLHRLLIAVVTEGPPRPFDVPIGSTHRMSVHVLTRDATGEAMLQRARVTELSLAADLGAAHVSFPSETAVRTWLPRSTKTRKAEPPLEMLPHVIDVAGRRRIVVPVSETEPRALLIDAEYPAVGPVVVRAEPDGAGVRFVPLSSPWDQVAPSAPQVDALVRAAAGRRPEGTTDRVAPVLGSLSERHALVVGLGSVGSRIAEDLVRSGLGKVTLVDPDVVEAANLSRTTYVCTDIGAPKPAALGRRLRAIDPSVDVTEHAMSVTELDLGEVVVGVDLVVAATDDMPQQAVLSHHAYAAGVPLVACALYRAGAAGEVVFSVPQAGSACWTCAVGEGTAADARRPEKDYGTGGRLVAEVALGPAIHLVTDVAGQLALGLLAGPETAAGSRVTRLLSKRQTLGLIATTPGWDFFPALFGDVAHQDAPQSVWVTVAARDNCPACGPSPVPPVSAAEGAELVSLIERLADEARDARPSRGPADLLRRPRLLRRAARRAVSQVALRSRRTKTR